MTNAGYGCLPHAPISLVGRSIGTGTRPASMPSPPFFIKAMSLSRSSAVGLSLLTVLKNKGNASTILLSAAISSGSICAPRRARSFIACHSSDPCSMPITSAIRPSFSSSWGGERRPLSTLLQLLASKSSVWQNFLRVMSLAILLSLTNSPNIALPPFSSSSASFPVLYLPLWYYRNHMR